MNQPRGEVEPSQPNGSVAPSEVRNDVLGDLYCEAIVIAIAVTDAAQRLLLLRRLDDDHFSAALHKQCWKAVRTLAESELAYDETVLAQVATKDVANYIKQLVEQGVQSSSNLLWQIDRLHWLRTKRDILNGVLGKLVEAIRDDACTPDKAQGLARAVVNSFDGSQSRKFVTSPIEAARSLVREIEARVDGGLMFPYGIEGLDWYESQDNQPPKRRMLPGAAPGQITVITGVSGSGKSVVTANLVLGLIAQKRKVLYGAWEMPPNAILELLCCIKLQWSRTDLLEAKHFDHAKLKQLRDAAEEISQYVMIMGNPFQRHTGEKKRNWKNLDLIQGYIEDTRCEVFVADLWRRCLREASVEEEEDALYRQQAMAAELNVHVMLLQQQRLKDVEMRADKRPTREGVKGTSAWVDIADTMIATHRQYLFKKVEDTFLELLVLKQRYGKWPIAVEFQWEADKGRIFGGRSIDYTRPGESNDLDGQVPRKGWSKGR